MKRIIAILMVLTLMLAFAACAKKADANHETAATTTTTEAPSATNAVADVTVVVDEDNTSTPSSNSTAPIDILNTVWGSYAEDEKFPGAGGDMLTEETTNWEGPAAFGTEGDAVEALTSILHFPADSVAKISGAASLMHAMNANTFTCGAFQVVNASDIATLTSDIKATIDGTQWMCGFPEKMLIVAVDNTIIACVGNGELVDNFNAKLTAAYTTANVLVDEAIVA